jgi:hypothetical protein
MSNAIPSSLPPALASLVEADPDWRWPFIEWRVTQGGQLEAIAHAVRDESIWRLICALMESALQAGWEAGARCHVQVTQVTQVTEDSPSRELELSTAG